MKPTKELAKSGQKDDHIMEEMIERLTGKKSGYWPESIKLAMQEYAEAYHKEKIGDTSIDALDFVHQWFYKLSIGQTTQGEVADAIEQFHKEKLREELISYNEWYYAQSTIKIYRTPDEELVDEYLKTKE